MVGITARSAFGKLAETESKKIEPFYITAQKIGSNRIGLDAIAMMAYRYATAQTAEVGSTNKIIKLTGHSTKVGDLVVFQSGTQDEFEIHVEKIIDANNIELSAICSTDLTGSTFDLLRPKTPRVDSTGSTLATVAASPLIFTKDGADQEVIKDTATPSNTVGLPVEIVGATGAVINITAGDINVQTSHSGANYDSQRIGDGTTLLGITLSNEAKTFDSTTHGKLDTVNTNLGNIETDTTAISADVNALVGALSTVATDSLRVAILSSALPTGAATETKQDSIITKLTDIDTSLNNIEAEDFATETTLLAMSGKLPATLGQKAMTASLAVVIASDQSPIQVSQSGTWNINNVSGTVSLPTGASTSAKQDTGNTSLSNIDTKLPAALGQLAMAASLSVTIASNQSAVEVKESINANASYDENTAIDNATVVTFTAPANAVGFLLEALEANTANLRWKMGANPTTTSGMQLQGGRDSGFIPGGSDVKIISEGATGGATIQWIRK